MNHQTNSAVSKRLTAKTSRATSAGTEMVAYMAELIKQQLSKDGLPEHRIDKIAIDVMSAVKFAFGGQMLYFPMIRQTANEKAEEMYVKFMGGATVEMLAAEYGHSIQWTYFLLAKARSNRRLKRTQDVS